MVRPRGRLICSTIAAPGGNAYAYYFFTAAGLAVEPDSRRVVKALTGDFALTARANLTTKWLRRAPVARGLVRFLGLPMDILLAADTACFRLDFSLYYTIYAYNSSYCARENRLQLVVLVVQ